VQRRDLPDDVPRISDRLDACKLLFDRVSTVARGPYPVSEPRQLAEIPVERCRPYSR
jgi:hypothetical protein